MGKGFFFLAVRKEKNKEEKTKNQTRSESSCKVSQTLYIRKNDIIEFNYHYPNEMDKRARVGTND